MMYSYAKGAEGDYVVTGTEGAPLYRLRGFTEAQAIETAFRLNAAYMAGQTNIREDLRKLLGVSA
jgi:hypothetical protein